VSTEQGFDPQAPEGAPRGSSAYVTRKDVKVVGVVLVVLAIFSYPVFKVLVRYSERTRCTLNMKAIMDAMSQYAIQNDEKFPPLYDSGGNDEPMPQASGAPFTWASTLKDYMSPRAGFVCPGAQPRELRRSQDPKSANGSFALSYGMFAPMGSYNRSQVEDPDEAVLIAETSNRGSNGSYDPLPFKDPSGQLVPYDGAVIGWNNDNFDGNEKTKSVTRLAFSGTAGGVFKKDGEGRHDDGTLVLTVSGHLRPIHPDSAIVVRRNNNLYGVWPMPIDAKRHK
jgi:hypothetical protein